MAPGIQQIEVSDLTDLIAKVPSSSPGVPTGSFREGAIYRGMVDKDWPLLTSLDRLGSPPAEPHSKRHLEESLFRKFINFWPSDPLALIPTEWNLLVIAQHHGLPTRLMDWTYSPLVAAHFATTGGDPMKDRVVWKLDWKSVHEHFDFPPLVFTVEKLEETLNKKSLPLIWDVMDIKNPATQPFVCVLEPPSVDARIVAQSAIFTLSSDKMRSLDQTLTESGLADTLTRFVIPADKVPVVREQLDLCGIDERRLFPDLGGITSVLRRHYSTSA